METNDQKPNNPHDSMVRAVFGVPEHASELLKAVLPAKLIERLDVSAPVVRNTHFVSEKLIPSEADLLFQVRSKDGQDMLIYALIEHQSSSARLMGYRIYCYIEDFWTTELRQKRKEGMGASQEELPIVFPVVLYHGDRPWNAPMEVYDLIGGNEDLKSACGNKLPRLSYEVVDLTMMSEEEISSLLAHSALRLCMFCLKYSRMPDRILEKLKSWGDLWNKVLRDSEVEIFRILLYYVSSTSGLSDEDWQEFTDSLPTKAKEEAMTYFERLEQRGEQRGRQEGEQKRHWL